MNSCYLYVCPCLRIERSGSGKATWRRGGLQQHTPPPLTASKPQLNPMMPADPLSHTHTLTQNDSLFVVKTSERPKKRYKLRVPDKIWWYFGVLGYQSDNKSREILEYDTTVIYVRVLDVGYYTTTFSRSF